MVNYNPRLFRDVRRQVFLTNFGRFGVRGAHGVLKELLTVPLLPHIREVHGWSDEKILRFVMSLPAGGAVYPGPVTFLSLAHEADEDVLVTTDGRHLLRLKKYRRTRIVTPTQFLDVFS